MLGACSNNDDACGRGPFVRRSFVVLLLALQIAAISCSGLEKPESEPYFAQTTPPRKQEFRWSNGKLPKSMDPARAAVPPETDLVRAVFEGLTDIDPRTLEAKPAIAESWTLSEDFRTWTFTLRADARWSNGRPVTAEDFVRSWKRLGELGDKVAHHELLSNFVGFPIKHKETGPPTSEILPNVGTSPVLSASPTPTTSPEPEQSSTVTPPSGPASPLFGISAVDDRTLKVLLLAPDKDLPKLVANPLFRPVFGDGGDLVKGVNGSIVTNGPFRIDSVGGEGIGLVKSETYWNRDAVRLERVMLVATDSAEQALAAYRQGELEAVTNAEFEPLALKLLEPFEDFRRRTHAAINFYEINHEKAPFDDRRVREALAISIERERVTEGEMDGVTQPALSFIPFGGDADAKLIQDKERARDLLAEAGFPSGQGFPVVRLVVNRNDVQQRVARAVARMWKQNLNVETELIVKESSELEGVRQSGDFDLIRRNEVFASADELMNILAILRPPKQAPEAQRSPEGGVEARDPNVVTGAETSATPDSAAASPDVTMSEENALYELWAIPLYFPTSYSLVKPYVAGFEMNSLDAPSLTDVAIDSDWQPK